VEVEEIAAGGTALEEGVEVTATRTLTSTEITEISIDLEDAVPVLEGLLAIADSRLNSVTLVGEQRLIDLASQYLLQLDLRRRQVAVNVKIVDVSLGATDEFGASFSFGVNDANITNTAGTAIINFGESSPNTGAIAPGSTIGVPTGLGLGSSLAGLANQFLLQLQAQIVSNNAKILTDPTLIIQEGQTASVNLTQDVVSNVESQLSTETGQILSTTIETEEAGLILTIQVSRIDDNGFVTVNVTPSVTAISPSSVQVEGITVSLLTRREVSSGDVRLRDGQTLILAGIIQDQERTTVTKVPILGDIPILGALFRSTSRQDERDEVIVMLTPQILDDSDQSTFGYSYTPGEDVQELLERSRRR
nr:type II and III secretion system protein [Leptolyngbyaceae cyanobacterium MO_188.B28]